MTIIRRVTQPATWHGHNHVQKTAAACEATKFFDDSANGQQIEVRDLSCSNLLVATMQFQTGNWPCHARAFCIPWRGSQQYCQKIVTMPLVPRHVYPLYPVQGRTLQRSCQCSADCHARTSCLQVSGWEHACTSFWGLIGFSGIFFTTNSHVFSDPPNHWNGIRLNCFDLFPIRHCTIQCSIYAHLNDISCHDRSLDLHWWWGWCLTFVFLMSSPYITQLLPHVRRRNQCGASLSSSTECQGSQIMALLTCLGHGGLHAAGKFWVPQIYLFSKTKCTLGHPDFETIPHV